MNAAELQACIAVIGPVIGPVTTISLSRCSSLGEDDLRETGPGRLPPAYSDPGGLLRSMPHLLNKTEYIVQIEQVA
jgi:hypothetical protein